MPLLLAAKRKAERCHSIPGSAVSFQPVLPFLWREAMTKEWMGREATSSLSYIVF